jgi:hypothetical protein
MYVNMKGTVPPIFSWHSSIANDYNLSILYACRNRNCEPARITRMSMHCLRASEQGVPEPYRSRHLQIVSSVLSGKSDILIGLLESNLHIPCLHEVRIIRALTGECKERSRPHTWRNPCL